MILGTMAVVAGSGGAIDAITRIDLVTLSTPASQITFSSIPGTYDDLMILFRHEQASTASWPTMRLNSDSGSNYSITSIHAYNGAMSTFDVTANSAWFLCGSNNVFGSASGIGQLDIINYASTSHTKNIMSTFGAHQSTNGAHWVNAGRWNSTAAITTIQLRNDGTNNYFNTGSSFALYGIKRAA